MTGTVTRLLTRTDFAMSGLGPGTVSFVTIARKLDTSLWREGVVMARLHAATWTAGSSISILYGLDAYTDEDPAAVWSVSSTTLMTFTEGTDAAPSVKVAALPLPFGPLMQIALEFVGSGATFTPSLSLDLNLKGN